jgi:hypothetical protein
MFAALSRAMHHAPPADVDPDDLSDETYLRGILARSPIDADDVFAAGPRGVDTPVEYGWVHDELLAEGRWSIAPAPLLDRLAAYSDPAPAAFVLAPRREMPWSNSIAYGPATIAPAVRMNPLSLPAEDGIGTGLVTLATNHGSLSTAFAADPRVREGVVSITHGHTDANPGDLTSGKATVDQLTAMPHVAGLEVEVTALGAAAREGEQRAGP